MARRDLRRPHYDGGLTLVRIAIPDILADEQAALKQRFDAACDGTEVAAELLGPLEQAFTASPFFAEIAIRQPRALLDLVSDASIGRPRTSGEYVAMITAVLDGASDVAAAKRLLRETRQLEAARIAWRDIVLGTDVHNIMAELSAFADAIIAGTVSWLGQTLEPRFGRARDENGEVLELGVVGMGKLGGGELNFSSDIDLIFVYQCAGTTDGGRKDIDHQEYFDRLGREFIALLNETTADGYVFRVDMRLRPFGDSGPLTTSLAALEHYYATHGRDWERYALIKARMISGNARAQKHFEALTRPFVFRRYLDYGALESLREMKRLINDEADSAALAADVKRGTGGIREIEFTGQLFQLIRGGREPDLRTRSIVAALDTCATLKLLESADVDELKQAYAFLRTTEHRLQQAHDWQTHALPESEPERERLRFALGFPSWDAFATTLSQHRTRTQSHFQGLLEAPDEDNAGTSGDGWARAWQHAAEGDDDAATPGPDGPLSAGAEQLLSVIAHTRFLNRLSREGRERLDRLVPLLLESAEAAGTGASAYAALAKLITTVARRSVYMSFLADNPPALKRLLELFEASPWIAGQITAHPLLLDELLDARQLYSPPQASALMQLAAQKIRTTDGLEQAMEALRAFRNQQVLRVAASDVMGHLPVARVSDQLTWTAEACVNSALDLAWSELTTRYGTPCCDDGGNRRETGFAVIAYGKMGGIELGYGSDLDLVFLNDSTGSAQQTNGEKSVENNVFYTRLAQRFIHILSTTTPSGTAYEVDTRLRPSGNAGMMVCPTPAFQTYLTEQAWVWEHQALVRARGIAGQCEVIAEFDRIRNEVLRRPRVEADLKQAIVEMRKRMLGEVDRGDDSHFDLKRGVGGITDIEFMVQYAVLRWAAQHDALLDWTDNLRLLETIAELELLPAAACDELRDAYFAYRAQIHRSALQQIDALVPVTEFADHRHAVQAIWKTIFD